jgi:hypothetical protein
MAYRETLNRPKFTWHFPARFFAGLMALSMLVCAQTGAGLADAARQAPNSRVAIELPESFKPSDRFSGFVDEISGASFLVVEMPAVAYEEVKAIGDKPDALAQRGIIETQKTPLPQRSGEYVYITGKQKTPAGDYSKHIMVTREYDVTVMVTGNVPQNALDSGALSAQQIERAFTSVAVKAEAARGEQMFALTYLGPFKETLSIMGNSKVYSLTGKIPEPGAATTTQEPVFVISPSVDKAPLEDVKASAKNSFRVIGNLSGHEVKGEKDITIGGLNGYEIVGEGDDPKTGLRSGLYVVLLSGASGGYYVMAGIASATGMQTYLPEFQKIAMGFEPRAGQ